MITTVNSKSGYLVSIFLLLLAFDVRAQLDVDSAWVREAPPRARVLAMFGQFSNSTADPISIIGASSSQVDRIEMHQTRFVDGMMKMQKVDRLLVKSGDVVVFKPGGLHFMLIRPQKAFKRGDQISISLHLGDGTRQSFSATVRAAAPIANGH